MTVRYRFRSTSVVDSAPRPSIVHRRGRFRVIDREVPILSGVQEGAAGRNQALGEE